MKISKRDLSLLLVLVGLIVFLAAYLGIYNNFNSKAEEIKTEVSGLKPRLEELQMYQSKLPEYEKGINAAIENVEAALKKYPGDVRAEDLTMYAIALQNDVGLQISGVSFAPVEVVSHFQIVRDGENGPEFIPMAAMKTGLSANCSLGYGELKRLVNYIYATEFCTTLDRVLVSYDAESGKLTGSVDLSKYFVSSMDYTYEPTHVPEVPKGTTNPFGTFTVTAASENTATA